MLNRIHAARIPLVFLDRKILGTAYPLVTSDNAHGVSALVAALIQKGYRRFGYYGVHDNMNRPEQERVDGFCRAISDGGLALDRKLLYPFVPGVARVFPYAQEVTPALLAAAETVAAHFAGTETDKTQPKSVLCCTNDYAAQSILLAAKRLNLAVPDRFGVAGFDNLPLAQETVPPLTTIGQDFFRLGQTAVSLVFAALRGEPQTDRRIPTTTILRGSV